MKKVAYITTTLGLLLGWSTSALEAQTAQRETAAVEPLSLAKFSCAASGKGATYMKICVSKSGQVVSFESPQGYEHIRVGQVFEGYAICGHQRSSEYEDTNYEPALAGDADRVQQPNGPNTFPLTIYDKMRDLELVQTFTRNAASRELIINMKLYNRTADDFYISRIRRGVDFDINNTPGDDVFTRTAKTIFASDWDGGMSLSGPGGGTEVFPFRSSWGNCFSPSTPWGTPTPPGDYVGVVDAFFGKRLPKGGFVEAKFVYHAID